MKRSDGTTMQRLTPEQLAYIVEHWAARTSNEIAATLDVRIGTVKAAASRLSLRKDPGVLSRIRSRLHGYEQRRNRPGPKPKTSPFSSHLSLLLGGMTAKPQAYGGRVHRIHDDDEHVPCETEREVA